MSTEEKAVQQGLPELTAFEAKRAARIVTPERARLAAQRLIDSHFNNAGREHARMSIPVNLDDDDIVILDFIEQSEAVNKELLQALDGIAKDAPIAADFAIGGKFDYDEDCGNSGDVRNLGQAEEHFRLAEIARPVIAKARGIR